MIRTAIIERVGPLIEEFAGELAELLAQDFDRRIGQLGEAFAVATSAFAAELAGASCQGRREAADLHEVRLLWR